MSQENVEIVRTAYAAFNRRDYDAVGAFCHSEAEWYPYLGVVEGDVYRGHEAIVKMWASLDEVFGDTLRVEARELIDCGDKVVVVAEASATGSESGAEVKQTWAQVMTVRDGLILRVEPYPDRDAALEAAGRSEWAMSQENVKLARQSYDAVNRRDLGALLDLMDDDVEAVSRIAAMEGGLHGHDGMRRWWESWFSAFPDYRIEVGEVRDRADFVFAAFRAHGHGAGSQLPFEDTVWHASRWRGGKCIWWRVCPTWPEALEATGLEE